MKLKYNACQHIRVMVSSVKGTLVYLVYVMSFDDVYCAENCLDI